MSLLTQMLFRNISHYDYQYCENVFLHFIVIIKSVNKKIILPELSLFVRVP